MKTTLPKSIQDALRVYDMASDTRVAVRDEPPDSADWGERYDLSLEWWSNARHALVAAIISEIEKGGAK